MTSLDDNTIIKMNINSFPHKVAISITAVILTCLGVAILIFSNTITSAIMTSELSLENTHTTQFLMWKETPIPLYMNIYLFNFSNYKEVEKNWSIKPHLVECGPYVFLERHIRKNITFNKNNTITFKTQRIWKYIPKRSRGSLDDLITNVNVIAATVGYVIRNKHMLVQKAVDFLFLEKHVSLTVTKTANQWLFQGYDDPLLDLAHKLNISGLNVPFKRFAWFTERNGSADYDGWFTIHTGAEDLNLLGRLTLWNGRNKTDVYESHCGLVTGTTGEVSYPVKNDSSITIFASDICGSLVLERNGSDTIQGIEGNVYIGRDRNFDNGTTYPEMSCYNCGKATVSGLRNISQCKFGAPAFISYPYFYLSDPILANSVTINRSNRSLHEFRIVIEPSSGIPLKIGARLQLNVHLTHLDHVHIFANVKPIFIPMFWFEQEGELPTNLIQDVKVLCILPSIGYYTAGGILAIGGFVLCVMIFVIVKYGWRNSEDEGLLLQQ